MTTDSARPEPSPRAMKPATAAKKLGVYLPATPEEFRAGGISREELREAAGEPAGVADRAASQRPPPPTRRGGPAGGLDLRPGARRGRRGPHDRADRRAPAQPAAVARRGARAVRTGARRGGAAARRSAGRGVRAP